MASLEVLIVIIYVTFAVYVLYRARKSYLADKAARRAKAKAGLIYITPDQEGLNKALDEQLAPLALKDYLDITLSSGITADDKVNLLSLKIDNRSTTYAVYLNWKESWLTNARNQSRSIARITPSDGSFSQDASMVPPGRSLQEFFSVLTAEGPQPLPEALALHILRQEGKADNPSAKVLLSLSIQLKSVSQFSRNHLIAVSCPITLRLPSDDEVQKYREELEKRFAKMFG